MFQLGSLPTAPVISIWEAFLLLHVTKPEMYTSFKAIKIPFDVVVKFPYESFLEPKQTLSLFSLIQVVPTN